MSDQPSDTLNAAIATGLAVGHWTDLENWLSEEASYAFKDGDPSGFGMVSDADFERLYAMLDAPSFYNEKDIPHKVFLFFESEWQRLLDTQKHKLLNAIEIVYGRLKDPVAWYVIAELLGEYYADNKGFMILQRLTHVENDHARSLVPVGFEKLIRNAPSQIGVQARRQLQRMLSDSAQGVRDEVRQALSRVS